MYITRIRLQNFKRHKEIEREFTPGVNAIFGPNGAGKTSLIEAIGFALFDYNPYAKQTELIRKGAQKTIIAVEFVSSEDEKLYLVQRQLTQQAAGKYHLFELSGHGSSPKQVCEGKEDTFSRLRELFSLDRETNLRDLFSSVLGVPQGTMTSVFLDKDSSREKVFDPLLQVDVYQRAKENMYNQFLKPLKQELQQLYEDIVRLEVQTQTIPTISEEFHTLQKELQEHQAEYLRHQEYLPRLQKTLEQMRSLQEQLRVLDTQRQQFRMEYQHLGQQIHDLLPQQQEAQRAQRILEQEEPRYLQHIEAEQQLRELRQKEEQFRQQSKLSQATEQQYQQIQNQFQTTQEQWDALQSMQSEWNTLSPKLSEQSVLSQERERASQAHNESMLFLQEIQELQQELDTLQQAVEQNQKHVQMLADLQYALTELERIKQEGLTLKESLHSLLQAQQRREFLSTQHTKLQGSILERKQQIEGNKQQLGHLQHRYKTKGEQYPILEESIQGKQQHLAQLESRAEQEKLFARNVSGGICPYFQSPCRNVPEGQHLEEYMTDQIQRCSDAILHLKQHIAVLEKDKEDAKKALHTWTTESTRLQTQITQWEHDLQQFLQEQQSLDRDLQQHPDQTETVQQREQQISTLRDEYRTLEPLAKQAKDWCAEHKKGLLLQETHTQRLQALQKKQALLQTAQIQARDLPQLTQRLEQLKAPCLRAQFCEQEIKKIPELQQQSIQLQAKLEQLQIQRTAEQQALLAIGFDEALLLSWHKVSEQTQASYQHYLSHQKTAQKLQDYEQKLQELHQKQRDAQQQADESERLYQQHKGQFESDTFHQLVEKERHLFGRMKTLENEIQNQQQRQQLLEQQLEQLEQLKQRMGEKQHQHQQLDKVRVCSEFLRETYDRARPEITRLIMASVSEEARRIFSQLINSYHMKLRWTDQENSRYVLMVEEDGIDRSFANLSGGEQMAAALALRMALIKELSNIRIAFLDEPTAHMDEDRRRNLAAQISQIQGFQQLFVISHDDTFDQYTQHIVHIP